MEMLYRFGSSNAYDHWRFSVNHLPHFTDSSHTLSLLSSSLSHSLPHVNKKISSSTKFDYYYQPCSSQIQIIEPTIIFSGSYTSHSKRRTLSCLFIFGSWLEHLYTHCLGMGGRIDPSAYPFWGPFLFALIYDCFLGRIWYADYK